MAHFLHMEWSSDLQLYVAHHAEYLFVMRHNSDGLDQILVPKSGGFREFLIKELYVTPLASHLGV